MDTRKGAFLLVFTLALLVGGVLVDQLYVKKLKRDFVTLNNERIQTTNGLATARIVHENLHRVRDLVFENMVFPNKPDSVDHEARVFDFITNCINDLKLTLVSLQPSRPQTTGLVTTYGYDVEFLGDFFKFGELCSEFENSRRIISVESFSVSLSGEEEKKEGGPQHKGVKLRMRINTYQVKKS